MCRRKAPSGWRILRQSVVGASRPDTSSARQKSHPIRHRRSTSAATAPLMADRLPHRAVPAHRRGGGRPGKAAPHRFLSLLWRADEETFPAPAGMESQPGTAALPPTILRMNARTSNDWIAASLFRTQGQGHGELCPLGGKRRSFQALLVVQTHTPVRHPAHPPPAGPSWSRKTRYHDLLPARLTERQPTQNATVAAELPAGK